MQRFESAPRLQSFFLLQASSPVSAMETKVHCRSDPNGVRPRGQYPPTIDPDPPASDPIPLTVDPDVARSRSDADWGHHHCGRRRRRRRNAWHYDANIYEGGGEKQGRSEETRDYEGKLVLDLMRNSLLLTRACGLLAKSVQDFATTISKRLI